jgi:hypothetical protein
MCNLKTYKTRRICSWLRKKETKNIQKMKQLCSKFSRGSGHVKRRSRLGKYKRLTSCNLHLYNIRICRQWEAESIECFYRLAGFLAVVWFSSPPPPTVSKLSLFLSLPVCRRSSLLVGELEGARSQIIWSRESLALCKSFNTLWWTHPEHLEPMHARFLRSESEQNYYLLR